MSKKLNADQIMSVFLAILGIAMLVGGVQMDRLEIRQIHPASIPGLVPIILGSFMIICSGFLFKSSFSNNNEQSKTQTGDGKNSTARLVITTAICLFFALILVGRVPFIISCSLFISAFGVIFSWSHNASNASKIKTIIISIVIGVIAGVSISLLFQYGFLVRLP